MLLASLAETSGHTARDISCEILLVSRNRMSLDFEYGVLFRARTGATELFDCPLSRHSARDVARLLARRWHAEVEVLPCGRDGRPHEETEPSRS